jgi:hypothetical protein
MTFVRSARGKGAFSQRTPRFTHRQGGERPLPAANIVFVSDSQMTSDGNPVREPAIPLQVEALLGAQHTYHNFAKGGQKLWEQYNLLMDELAAAYDPEAPINILICRPGVNDLLAEQDLVSWQAMAQVYVNFAVSLGYTVVAVESFQWLFDVWPAYVFNGEADWEAYNTTLNALDGVTAVAPVASIPEVTSQANIGSNTTYYADTQHVRAATGGVLVATVIADTVAKVIRNYEANDPVNVAWNPADKTSLVALSGENKIVTLTVADNYPQAVRSVQSWSSGVLFARFLHIERVSTGGQNVAYGVAGASYDMTTKYLGETQDSVGVWPAASPSFFFWADETPIPPPFNLGDGQTMDIVINLDLKKFWAWPNSVGWNGDVIANQNPALGIGGFDFSALNGAPWFLCFQGEKVTESVQLINAAVA